MFFWFLIHVPLKCHFCDISVIFWYYHQCHVFDLWFVSLFCHPGATLVTYEWQNVTLECRLEMISLAHFDLTSLLALIFWCHNVTLLIQHMSLSHLHEDHFLYAKTSFSTFKMLLFSCHKCHILTFKWYFLENFHIISWYHDHILTLRWNFLNAKPLFDISNVNLNITSDVSHFDILCAIYLTPKTSCFNQIEISKVRGDNFDIYKYLFLTFRPLWYTIWRIRTFGDTWVQFWDLSVAHFHIIFSVTLMMS